MDFRRPGEHPNEEQNHHFDGTDGVMPPVQHSFPVVKPKSTAGYKFSIFLLTLLFIAAVAGAGYLYWDGMQLKSQINDQNVRIASISTELSTLKQEKEKAQTEAVGAAATRDRVANVAGVYACNIDKFGCDKVSKTVTKLREYVPPGPGFAIVKITSESTNQSTNLYLRSVDGEDWAVIYEGSTAPSKDVVTRYAIPSDFTTLP